MEFKRDAYCGLYCGACPVFLATADSSPDALQALAEQMNTDPETLRCYGCKSEKTVTWRSGCRLKACARERGLEFCIECDEYPCANLVAFTIDRQYAYHTLVLKNMEVIRREGVTAWLEQQAGRWRCAACGTSHSWYDAACPACESPTRNWTD
ncbi:MAG: DUF3795 domain-containing protein [Anaerolineae bacterium]|jgi:rubrerythrin|nr:DUF3795 domain-containing protein [Anaerolineae bacterium]